MHSARILPLVLFIPALLAACTASKGSVEQNARHMAYQIERIHFDPNTRPLTADNIRSMAVFLGQFYDMGKKDRAAGLTQAQAQQRADLISNNETSPFTPGTQKAMIINRAYDADQQDKRIAIMKAGAIKSYWDGYNGRP